MIFQTNTIINPRTVMVHKQNAVAANFTMMSACWFDFIADVAFFFPKIIKLFCCFAAVAKKFFYVA